VSGELVLEAVDLDVGYGEMTVVHGASMSAHAGEITAIVGPNGSGKSTLLRALCGLLPTKSGRLHILGTDATGVSTEELIRRGVGYLPQLQNVFASLTIRENLEVGAHSCRAQTRERMAFVFDLFPDLATAERKVARTLSGGQRNMLALSRALMTDPQLLIVDEPTAGLSPIYSSTVWRHLVQVAARGVSIVIVEQNTHLALENSHSGYLLVNGRVVLNGSGRLLLEDEHLAELYLGRQASAARISHRQNREAQHGRNQ
jgi:ABC-type branched-subunit amino acid transport system ATPase component